MAARVERLHAYSFTRDNRFGWEEQWAHKDVCGGGNAPSAILSVVSFKSSLDDGEHEAHVQLCNVAHLHTADSEIGDIVVAMLSAAWPRLSTLFFCGALVICALRVGTDY